MDPWRGSWWTLLLLVLALFGELGHGSPTLLLATNKDVRVYNVSRSKATATTIIKDLTDGVTLDFYYERSLVCWSDTHLEMIQCVNTNGTYTQNPFVVVNESLGSPERLAVDWFTGKLYWTDGEKNRIEVMSIDGRHRKVLYWTDIYQPRAIALVPMKGIFFWTDWGDVPKIERAGMNGDPSTRSVIVSEDIFWPNGLAIDYENELVYWTDGRLKFISVMDYYGRNRRKILSEGLEYPFAIAFVDQRLYWSDWRTWCVHTVDLSAPKLKPRELFQGQYTPGDVKVWDAKRQPPAVNNPCKVNNGNCSHLCLLSPKSPGYTCECPTGIKLLDKHTCAKEPEDFLLIVQRNEISFISLDSPDYTNFVLPLTGIKHAIAIDFDPVEERLYWTDEETHSIRRAKVDGTAQEDVLTAEVKSADGIAVDWIARNLYWTDTGTDRIEVARLDGSHRKVLIHEDLGEPRAIALALELGWMIWTDWDDKKPKIERSNMDGTERVVLVNKDIAWPNGIALDIERKKIYWCDAKTDKIEVCNMDGTDRREVVSENLPHLFGFSLLGDYLYWTDWQRRSIDRAHKLTGGERETIVEQVANVMGLKAVHRGRPKGTNMCAKDNGGCNQLCLNRPKDNYVCACEIGYELSKDARTCAVPEAFLIFAKKDKIGKTSIQTPGHDDIIPITGIKDASALDFEWSDNRIYWPDVKLKTINRAFMNGSGVEKVVDLGLETPDGVAVDWISHNLYWSDSGTRRIEVVYLRGFSHKVLIWQGLQEPKCLALDPERGQLYWAEWSNSGSIEKSWLDGTHRSVVVARIGRANGLTLDHSSRRLYWADLFTPAIDSYDLVNKIRKPIITEKIGYPFSVTQYKDYVYWADWNSGDIERADKLTGANRTKIHDNLESVTDLLLCHKSRQPGWNTCAVDNGECSDLCIAMPGNDDGGLSKSHTCACPTHYSLASDGKTCTAPQNFILYSYRNVMNRLLPDTNDCPDVALRIQGLKNVRAIEFDPISQYIYWIRTGESRNTSIKKTLENQTSTVIVFAANSAHPYDLAVDPLGRLLFWSCSVNDAINVTRLDTDTPVGVVVKASGEKPRNLAVYPERRLLFWTDVGDKMRVVQALMDGKNRVYLADELPSPATSLAVDTTTDLVYWAYGGHVEYTKVDGGARQVLLSNGHQGPLDHLSVLGDYVYWFDRETQSIERVDKRSGSSRKVVLNNRPLTDLVTVATPTKHAMDNNECSPMHEYGGCSHLCVGNGKCSCPQGLVLADDGKNCRVAPSCAVNHFTCHVSQSTDSKECIPESWKCDSQKDCTDGSDEINCPPCDKLHYFECHNGHCIENSAVCDGTLHCSDGEDEVNCCQAGQFRCLVTGACISATALCDGWENCLDGTDESDSTCNGVNGHRQAVEATAETGKNPYVVAVVLVLTVVVTTGLGFVYWRNKSVVDRDGLPDVVNDSAMDALSPKGFRNGKPLLSQKSNRKDLKPNLSVRMSTINGSSISSSYERSHITGFSYCPSSSTHGSSAEGYPQETLNPPPSPATTANSTRYSSSNASRYRPYRNYRNVNKPHPPTPCSTDVCDESDGNYSALPNFRYEHQIYRDPPPTPFYQSDTAISCPPSPSSRSSTYFCPSVLRGYQDPPPSPEH